MELNREEQRIVQSGKLALKNVRSLYREKLSLEVEYNDIFTPKSPVLTGNKGVPVSQVSIMNEYAEKRELISIKIEMINQIIQHFMNTTLLLSNRQRQIVEIYITSKSYKEMEDTLSNQYYISISTYKRELPKICLLLNQYIDLTSIPSLSDLNQKFLQFNLS